MRVEVEVMASLLGGSLLQAREGAHFKQEQEGDLHAYLKRRVAEGKIKLSDEELRALSGSRSNTSGLQPHKGKENYKDNDDRVFEVGMEILQQSSRYETLNSAAKARMLTRVKAAMPDASPEDLRRISTNMAMYGAAGALYGAHRSQKLALGGGRRALAELSRDSARYASQQQVKELSPEATEAMRRQFFAGLRALTYGTVVGVVGVTAAVTVAANVFEIGDATSLRSSMKAALEPLGAAFQGVAGLVAPPASWAQGSGPARGEQGKSEFAKRLKERFDKLRTNA